MGSIYSPRQQSTLKNMLSRSPHTCYLIVIKFASATVSERLTLIFSFPQAIYGKNEDQMFFFFNLYRYFHTLDFPALLAK